MPASPAEVAAELKAKRILEIDKAIANGLYNSGLEFHIRHAGVVVVQQKVRAAVICYLVKEGLL